MKSDETPEEAEADPRRVTAWLYISLEQSVQSSDACADAVEAGRTLEREVEPEAMDCEHKLSVREKASAARGGRGTTHGEERVGEVLPAERLERAEGLD